MDQLDRPIWHALCGRQSNFARGEGGAKRFRPDVSPFIALDPEDSSGLDAVRWLLDPEEEVLFCQRDEVPIPGGCKLVEANRGVQMVAEHFEPTVSSTNIIALGEGDVPAMLELARLSEPGPFRDRTCELSQFWGIKDSSGRLLAMAGERLRISGRSELSGVCTHPEVRGRGFAKSLSRHVASDIVRRGEAPFLHVYADNHGAIALYEQLGFRRRCFVEAVAIRLA